MPFPAHRNVRKSSDQSEYSFILFRESHVWESSQTLTLNLLYSLTFFVSTLRLHAQIPNLKASQVMSSLLDFFLKLGCAFHDFHIKYFVMNNLHNHRATSLSHLLSELTDSTSDSPIPSSRCQGCAHLLQYSAPREPSTAFFATLPFLTIDLCSVSGVFYGLSWVLYSLCRMGIRGSIGTRIRTSTRTSMRTRTRTAMNKKGGGFSRICGFRS